ncbi:MAG TPA: oligosaccharide flippase family protein [Acidimicrobiales bacterium]|nr:oligosaccharide flippase family protein [Acidimicrobiales bacterium]
MDFLTGNRWEHPLLRFGCHKKGDVCDEHPHGDAKRMSLELGAAQVLGGLVTVGWLAIAAHELTKAQVGDLTYIVTLGGLVGLGTDLGVPLALAKVACDHDRLDRGAVYAAVARRLTAGWLAAIILIAVWSSGHHSAHWWLAAIYGVSVVVSTVTSSALAALRGRAIGIVEAGYQLASQVVLAAGALIALQLGAGLYGVIITYVAVDAAGALVVPRVAQRYIKIDDTVEPAERSALALRATLPLVTAEVLGNAYERIDIALLGVLKGTAAVASYVVAYKLYDTVLLPAKAIAASAIAAAGRGVLTDGRAVAKGLIQRTLSLTVPLVIVVAVAAQTVLSAVFGRGYAKDSVTLVLLLASAIPGAVLVVITPIVLLAERRLVVRWTAAGLVANILANLVLVPLTGIRGAATAFLLTESGLCLVFWLSLPHPRTRSVPATAPAAPANQPPA